MAKYNHILPFMCPYVRGQKLGIMQVAKKMLNVKVNEKVVRELTGLTEEEIERIKM